MSARMTPIVKLAREIWWWDFSPRGRRKYRKASQWQAIKEDKRQMYLSEARRFAYLLKRIDVNVLNDNLEII